MCIIMQEPHAAIQGSFILALGRFFQLEMIYTYSSTTCAISTVWTHKIPPTCSWILVGYSSLCMVAMSFLAPLIADDVRQGSD